MHIKTLALKELSYRFLSIFYPRMNSALPERYISTPR